jgi:hypothetical protein
LKINRRDEVALDERIGQLPSTQGHAQADRRTLADLLLQIELGATARKK